MEKKLEKINNLAEENISFVENYRTFVEQACIGLYVIQKGYLRYVNQWFCAILGYEKPEELIGKSIWDLVHPEDRKLVNLEVSPHKEDEFANKPAFRIIKKSGKINLGAYGRRSGNL